MSIFALSDLIVPTSFVHQSDMPVLMSLIAFSLGGCIGSFANATAMRLVRAEDFIYQPSRCRMCQCQLTFMENMPFIGWLRHRGMCRCAKMKLSYRYVIIELAFGLLIMIYALKLPAITSIGFSLAAIFIGISILTDAEAMTLHPAVLSVFALVGTGFAAMGMTNVMAWHLTIEASFVGIFIGAATPLSINMVYRLVRKRNGFGEGDFWMLGAIGAWTGWQGALSVLFSASAIAALAGLFMIFIGKASALTRLPFGVFLGGVFILWSIFLI